MSFKITSLLLALSFSTLAFSEDIFRVAPYMLRHTNGHILLNFQTNSDQSFTIEDNGEIKRSFTYKKNQQYKLELSSVACGQTKEIKIKSATTKEVFYQNTLPPAPCKKLTEETPFVFGFISDTQQFRDRHEDIAKTIATQHSIEPLQFLINGGDVVQTGNLEQDWIDYFLGGKLYLMSIPQIAAIGNHDYRGNDGSLIPKYFQQFMRWNGSDKFGNLFFDFPTFQLLILNSNFSQFSFLEEDQVWNWLEDKMIDAEKKKKPLIIATHFPAFSSSLNRFSSLTVMKLRNVLAPLAERYKVPLILSGHTHMYERSFKSGIHYLVAGPAGGRPNTPSYTNEYMQFFDKDSLTFTKIKLFKKVFYIETFNQDNKLIDKIDINLK